MAWHNVKIKCDECGKVFVKYTNKGMKEYLKHIKEHKIKKEIEELKRQSKEFDNKSKIFMKLAKAHASLENYILAEVSKRLSEVCNDLSKNQLKEVQKRR